MKYLIKIETINGRCYLAYWDSGNPPLSFHKTGAKCFDSREAAEAEIVNLKNQFPLLKRMFPVELESA